MASNSWLSPACWRDFEKDSVTAHRIYSSPAVWIERFAGDLLVSQKNKIPTESLLRELSDWATSVSFRPRRIFLRELVHNPTADQKPKLVSGEKNLSPETIVREYALNYLVNFDWHYSVGFFIDQRANRAFLRKLAPKKLLNCFAYTSSFSVVAANLNAETTSIDISKTALEHAKENFRLNDLSTEGHYFIADDVRDVLPRFIKKGRKFDAIVLDPPTFSRSKKGGVFNVEKEMDSLIEMAVCCAEPGASILVSTNCASLSVDILQKKASSILKKINRKASFKFTPPLPDIPASSMPSTLWIELR